MTVIIFEAYWNMALSFEYTLKKKQSEFTDPSVILSKVLITTYKSHLSEESTSVATFMFDCVTLHVEPSVFPAQYDACS